MKLLSIFLFLCSIARVCAFAQTGAYERMFVFYCLLLDLEANGVNKKIVPDCPDCSNFNKFLQYIEQGKVQGDAPDITRETRPEVDDTARMLINKGHTGEYRSTLIHNSVKADRDIALMIDELSRFVEGTIDRLPREKDWIFEGLHKSIQRVKEHRLLGRADAYEKKVRQALEGLKDDEDKPLKDNKGNTLKVETQKVTYSLQPNPPQGHQSDYLRFSPAATLRSIQGTVSEEIYQRISNEIKSACVAASDDSHNRNIESAKKCSSAFCALKQLRNFS
ncbi:hypothetical protein LTR84_010497 [Exophiala bonariae]|uniref:NACHT-NTPase and P-loop NTPases N-terminal domain-containing protein n=1 Tax=Exophiala bonariae TaxID=1690606 RepID=A0AAV9MT10_9EURO|nr:hypothetical protein LTR84_010497 [Exophiala bonariae]